MNNRGVSRNVLRIAVFLFCAGTQFACGLTETGPKVLLVVAHPDDEYYFAATVYRLAVERNVRVDELIVTDGEGGYRYSTLAEPYYKRNLTTESVGRKELPAIRRKETIDAGKILGIRHHYFLNQKDEHFTIDTETANKSGWDMGLIRDWIAGLILKEHYDYVFCILPRPTTHGAHQAATMLAAASIDTLPQQLRPLLLGFDTDATPLARSTHSFHWESEHAFAFDRTTRFGFQNSLNYQIVVDWMIGAHKSQGLLQTMCEKETKEYAWVSRASVPKADVTTASLASLLGKPAAQK